MPFIRSHPISNISLVRYLWLDIYMLGLAKRVLEEYKALVMKMAVDVPKEFVTKKNLFMFLDWQIMLTLPCLMPIMHFVNILISLHEVHHATL